MAEATAPDLSPGDLVELQVSGWAAGGQCVARHLGRVVFVRHTLPGERVRARITEVRSRLARADAVEILDASPDRVPAPCRHAGPGGCGGCDFQHVSLPAQRAAKAELVVDHLVRVGGVPATHPIGPGRRLAELEVAAVPVHPPGGAGDGPVDDPDDRVDGLRWRTRVRFAVDAAGRAGLRRHRSHQVLQVERCLIAAHGADTLVLPGSWRGAAEVESIASSTGDRLVVVSPPEPARDGRRGARRTPAGSLGLRAEDFRDQVPRGVAIRVEPGGGGPGRGWVREQIPLRTGDASARVSGSGFWQVHPGAPGALTAAVLDQLDPQPGDGVFDLYGGVGLFSLAVAPLVGRGGSVLLIEGSDAAVRDARRNLHEHPQVRCVAGRVEQLLAAEQHADLIVLDPPRSGAGKQVIERVAGLGARRISYVACDPAALARDTRYLRDHGYDLDALVAFDLFPMTRHVECVARFVPAHT